jgi:acetyl esterase/lipase
MTPQDVRLARLLDYTPIPKWLAGLSSGGILNPRVKSKYLHANDMKATGIPLCEFFYPNNSSSKILGLDCFGGKGNGHTACHADPFLEKPTGSCRFVLYLHGGAFVLTTTGHFRETLNRLVVATGAAVLAPNFSRPPEAKYPVALEECKAAYHWLAKRVVDPSRQIFVAGKAMNDKTAATDECVAT